VLKGISDDQNTGGGKKGGGKGKHNTVCTAIYGTSEK